MASKFLFHVVYTAKFYRKLNNCMSVLVFLIISLSLSLRTKWNKNKYAEKFVNKLILFEIWMDVNALAKRLDHCSISNFWSSEQAGSDKWAVEKQKTHDDGYKADMKCGMAN